MIVLATSLRKPHKRRSKYLRTRTRFLGSDLSLFSFAIEKPRMDANEREHLANLVCADKRRCSHKAQLFELTRETRMLHCAPCASIRGSKLRAGVRVRVPRPAG